MRHEPANRVVPLFAVRGDNNNGAMFQDDDMNSPADGPPKEPPASQQADRLDSWKAIAAYAKRDVTTVQRWEKREGMPIRRHLHDKRGSVYAFRGELDAWMATRGAQLAPEPPASRPAIRPVYWLAFALLVVAFVTWWLARGKEDAATPLLGARVVPLTDFEGMEQAAAISRDGRFVAFLSDRDGRLDAWVTQVGTGEFRNLTQGKAPELLNPEVRSLGFTPDGSLVTLWTRVVQPPPGTSPVNMWAVPVIGGSMRNFRSAAVEMDWSRDATRLVFHTTDPGDPTFVVERDRSVRQVHAGERGVHCHFQTWAPDDSFIYFTRGIPPDEMDLWRMRPDGSGAERLTHHNARVLYPVFVNPKTLFYLATSDDGEGPWLYSFDIDTRASQRISFGIEQYTSLAAGADGRRLVATVERAKASLWELAVTGAVAPEAGARRIELPTVGGRSPRLGPNYVVYVMPKGSGYGIWKLANGAATELASGAEARVVGGAAISPDGRQIAFAEESRRGTRLYVAGTQGGGARVLAASLEVRGEPAWSRDGTAITVAALGVKGRRLFSVPVDGGAPRVLVDAEAINPLWSSDGKLLVYSDTGVGPTFEVKAANADGTPHPIASLTLPRGSRRISFVPGRHALVVLQGEMRHVNFWYLDLDTGEQRQLSDFGREFSIEDFDVGADGQIVFDRFRDNSDIALIEMQGQ